MKHVVLVGADRPGRTLLLAGLLEECIAQHGWSERLHVRAMGVLAGAGRADESDREALRKTASSATACDDIDQTRVEACDVIVAISDESADLVLQSVMAERKPVLCLQDLIDGEAAGALRNGCEADQLVEVMRPEMEEVLRALIAA